MNHPSAPQFSLEPQTDPEHPAEEPTVFVIDDDNDVGASIRSLLHAMGMQVKVFRSKEAFLDAYDGSHGCLITDVRIPSGLSGTELQKHLPEFSVPLPVIIITAFADTSLTVQAMQNGAVTLLEKPYRDQELLEAVQAAVRVDRRQRRYAQQTREVYARLNSLSPSETVVLDFIIDGVTNKVIAHRLDVSIRTVENRRKRIYEKMQTDSVAALVRMVVEARIRSGD